MSASKVKRKDAGRRKPRQRSTKRSKQNSPLNTLLRLLPFTEQQLQRGATWGILALVGLTGLGLASWYGVPEMANRQIAEIASDAGFEVKRVEVRGAERVNELKVYEIVLAEKDRAMPMVDVERLRRDLVAFGWIEDARVSRQLPDTLVVDIVERVPHAAWQDGKLLSLIDSHGVVLERLDGTVPPGLPKIVGPGANRKIEDLGRLFDEAPALTPLVAEAEWIGNRRWNITFDSGEVLALPEGREQSASAWVNFARIDGVSGLLGTGVSYFDMRDPDRAYLLKQDEPDPVDLSEPVAPAPQAKRGGLTA